MRIKSRSTQHGKDGVLYTLDEVSPDFAHMFPNMTRATVERRGKLVLVVEVDDSESEAWPWGKS